MAMPEPGLWICHGLGRTVPRVVVTRAAKESCVCPGGEQEQTPKPNQSGKSIPNSSEPGEEQDGRGNLWEVTGDDRGLLPPPLGIAIYATRSTSASQTREERPRSLPDLPDLHDPTSS